MMAMNVIRGLWGLPIFSNRSIAAATSYEPDELTGWLSAFAKAFGISCAALSCGLCELVLVGKVPVARGHGGPLSDGLLEELDAGYGLVPAVMTAALSLLHLSVIKLAACGPAPTSRVHLPVRDP